MPAIWSRYDGAGDGVRVDGVNRMTDELLDVRSRREHGNQAYLDVRQTALERVETGVGEPGGSGVSAALAKLRSAWHELSNNPGSSAARAQVLSGAGTVVDAFKAQARNVQGEAGDQRLALQNDVAEVGTLAHELADLNGAVASGRANGDDVNVLLDRRDQITLRLSELTGATATLRPDGGADVSLGGVALVSATRRAPSRSPAASPPPATPTAPRCPSASPPRTAPGPPSRPGWADRSAVAPSCST